MITLRSTSPAYPNTVVSVYFVSMLISGLVWKKEICIRAEFTGPSVLGLVYIIENPPLVFEHFSYYLLLVNLFSSIEDHLPYEEEPSYSIVIC